MHSSGISIDHLSGTSTYNSYGISIVLVPMIVHEVKIHNAIKAINFDFIKLAYI